jgi:hypothetical protein
MFLDMYRDWAQMFDGEMGMAFEVSGITSGSPTIRGRGVWDTNKPALVKTMWSRLSKVFEGMRGGNFKFTANPRRATHRGTTIGTFTVEAAPGAPPETREAFKQFGGAMDTGYAVTGKNAVFSFGDDPVTNLKALLDLVANKKAKPAAAVAATVAQAKRRKDSFVMGMDIPSLAAQSGGKPAPAPQELSTVSLATVDGNLLVRFNAPASQIAPLVPMP